MSSVKPDMPDSVVNIRFSHETGTGLELTKEVEEDLKYT